MKNAIVAIILLLVGFLGGYATKGLLVGMEQNKELVKQKTEETGATQEKQEENNEITGVETEETNELEKTTKKEVSSDPVEAGLQGHLQVFKEASEGYLNSLAGKDLNPNDYNVFLTAEYKLYYDANGTLLSNKHDQWGNPYQVFMNPKKQKIVVQSNGEGKGGYVLASYQQSGNIESCTRGFKEVNWPLNHVFLKSGEACGGDLQ